MAEGLSARMLMEHKDDQGVSLFTSRAWRWLFDITVPLVHELILEFFSKFWFGEEVTNLDTAGALQFQLGGARRRLSWRQFILALGLYTTEEMKTGSHLLEISLAQPHPKLLLGIQFLGCTTEERLQGLTVIALTLSVIDIGELVRLQICVKINDTWAWVALGLERQHDATAGAPEAAEDALVVDEGGQPDSAPIHAPLPPPAVARTMPQRMARLEEDVHEIHRALAE
ncbi:hypothetical protein Tco_0072740 [Tanacetum coccineum]